MKEDREGIPALMGPPLITTKERAHAASLIEQLSDIRVAMLSLEEQFTPQIRELDASALTSARNLVHYLAFRQFDIRRLQEALASLGLSSLGRTEAHVLASVERVLAMLHLMAGRAWHPEARTPAVGFRAGRRLLDERTERLLGPRRTPRTVRIMVTMPTEAATDPVLVHDMLNAGMDVMRINCAHDDAATWTAMVENLRRAERTVGRTCKILMDLGGPKLRTGPVAGPAIRKCRPARDERGYVVAPARLWFTSIEMPVPPPADADAVVPVPAHWLARVAAGDRVTFKDARGARRTIAVTTAEGGGCWGEATKTCYLAADLPIRLRRVGTHADGDAKTRIGALAGANPAILLKAGETLRLTRAMEAGKPATVGADGAFAAPATIPCTLPEVFACVHPGERIWLDDGKIGGVIRSISPDAMEIEITHAQAKGTRLRADKGINLPDSDLRLPALTEKDLHDLEVAVRLADMIGLSFVRHADDVRLLQRHLERLDATHLGIVLKLETQRAFAQLPHLLLAAMHSGAVGVMIARGDLAVESGFERLAEVQEEILWLSEAAHLPTIWATQVLETLANTGLSTRAEITDAAMGVRAECVMLNKGPYIVATIRTLDDILRRMQGHRHKRVALLRQLHAWSASPTSKERPSSPVTV